MVKKLYVKDFGAVGDGITDDSVAIRNAVIELQRCGKDTALYFEKDKNYLFDSYREDIYGVFSLNSGERISIIGENTTITVASPNAYLEIYHTTDLLIEGFTFNMKVKPYFLGTAASEIDIVNQTAVFEVELPLEFELPIGKKEKFVTNDGALGFGVLDRADGRWHMFLEAYERVGENRIKVYFANTGIFDEKEIAKRMNMLKNDRIILPTPYVGHWRNTMCNIWNNTNVTLRNLNFPSGSKFMFCIVNNDGTVILDTVNMMPEGDVDFVCWRDGWHCKENHAKLIWNNCKASGLMDDIFNISSSVMCVKDIINETTCNFYWQETKGDFRRKLEPGEKVMIINQKSGEILADTEIAAVIAQSSNGNNIISFRDPIKNPETGEHVLILFPGLVAPGSLVENCWFNGTWRFRGPILIRDSYFYNRRMWLDIYSTWEGPIPWDITFKNCEFDFDKEPENEKFVHLSAYNENISETSYHVKNIRFVDCKIDPDKFEIGTGDEVIFENCTK